VKIRIEAAPGERARVERLLDVLSKAKQRDPGEKVELLIPALKTAHDRARRHRERVLAEMNRRIKRVLSGDADETAA
jgi:hypothetical protein